MAEPDNLAREFETAFDITRGKAALDRFERRLAPPAANENAPGGQNPGAGAGSAGRAVSEGGGAETGAGGSPADALRPFDPGRDKPRQNADGSQSTEVSRTVQIGGEWVNVPSLWWRDMGPVDLGEMNDDGLAGAAALYERISGKRFPRFKSIEEAEAAAVARSAAGGALGRSAIDRAIGPAEDAIEGAAADIGKGAFELVPQVAGGVIDAVNNLLGSVEDIDALIEETLGLPQLDPTRGARLPTTGEAATVTGGIARSTAQFLTGFLPAARAIKAAGMGAGFAQSMLAGAASDLAVWDPHEERLSTYLNEVPALAGIVPDYLADNDPEREGEWEGRLKNAIEGAGIGLAAEGLFRAFRAYKAHRAATAEQRRLAASPRDLAQQQAKDAMRDASRADLVQPLAPDALDTLGDPFGSMFIGAPRGETVEQAVKMERDARDLRLISGALPEGHTARFSKEGVSIIGPDRKRVAVIERPPNVDEAYLGTIGERIEKSGAVDTAIANIQARVASAATTKPAPGMVRLYHGGAEPGSGGSRWVTPDPEYARKYRAVDEAGNEVHFVDVPKDDPALDAVRDEVSGRLQNGQLPEEWAKRMRPFKSGAAVADPLDEMLTMARKGLGPAPDAKLPKYPALNMLKAKGGVQPGSPLASELKARGVTQRTMPGLFRRGGLTAADNFPAAEEGWLYPVGTAVEDIDANSYIPPEVVLDAIDAELFGQPRRDIDVQERVAQWNEAGMNAGEFRRDLEAIGVDFDTMDNAAIRRRMADVEGERARLREMDETPPPGSGDDYGVGYAEGAEPDVAGDPRAAVPVQGERKVYINHARINSTDDVKALIQEMADNDADAIRVKTRGSVSNAQTLKESAAEFQSLEDLIGRKPGPMGAAQAVAARKILTTSGEQLVGLAQKAGAPNASPADVFAFRRAMQVHYAIQAEVIAARTETARALQSWAIPAGSSKQRADAIAELLNNAGGAGDSAKLAQAIASLGSNPAGLNAAVQQSMRGKLKDVLFEVWINGLLTSPKTHMVNVVSNSLTAAWAIPETMLAAGIDHAFGSGDIAAGEAVALAYGAVKGVRDGFRFAANVSSRPELADLLDTFAKTEAPQRAAITAANFDLDPGSIFGRGVDLIGMAVRSPGSALEIEDRFFKALNYRMELQRQAFRMANGEGLEGQALAERIADILANPPETIRLEAIGTARVNTFTAQLGETGQKWQRAINSTPGGRVVVPFIRTPTNILKYTFARTPLGYLSSGIRGDIAAGGARAAQAQARIALGSMVMMTLGDLALDGVITGQGPADPQLRSAKMRSGWKPYSVKIGDRWFQYNRLDPLGMLAGFGADIGEIIGEIDEAEGEKLATAGVIAIVQNLASKTWAQGVFNLVSALDPGNPAGGIGGFVEDLAGSAIPFSSLLRHIRGATDPVLRDTRTAADADEFSFEAMEGLPAPVAESLQTVINQYRKNIPGLGEGLPARKDLWGRDITTDTGIGWVYDFLTPIGGAKDKDDPVDNMIVENGIRLGMPDRAIRGVRLTAEEYAQYVTLAGEPAKQYLDRLVSTPGFKRLSDGADGGKADMVNEIVSKFRDRAREQMMLFNPRLRDRYIELQRDKRLRLTVGAQ